MSESAADRSDRSGRCERATALLEQRPAKTRALKQGLMQELLTGKTRLPVAREPGTLANTEP